MNLDFFTSKGNSHKINQDYITNPFTNTLALSDGCSESEHVDVGARLVVHEHPKLKDSLIDLSLPSEALNCTHLRLEIHEQEKQAVFRRYGDGFLFIKTNGLLTITQYEYAQNAPYYVGYEVFDLMDEFLRLKNNPLIRTSWTFDESWKTVTIIRDLKFEPKDLLEEEIVISTENLDFVGIASDGLFSFSYPPTEVFREVFAFKNFDGEFVQRRMRKAMLALNGSNFDDLSIGVIHFGK